MNANGKNSAQLEREVESQRRRVEQTIGELQDRLSPGQLVDQALSYTKHGGGQFAGNLGRTVTANPLPVTLLGVGLAWLMASGKNGAQHGDGKDRGESYPLATTTSGGLQRVSHSVDQSGDWYSEFVDDAGRKYRAKSDSTGQRIGHFADETGKLFSGFIDEAGNRVKQFRDEAGNSLDSAGGWASHTWHDIRDAVSGRASGVADSASHLTSDMQDQADRLRRRMIRTFEQQPLIAGALAFAAGAALAAALPHTREEDEMLGDTADRIKDEAGSAAERLYDEGKERAASLYEDASGKAEEIFEQAKSTATGDGRSEGTVRH
jgi:gas vesicle protein